MDGYTVFALVLFSLSLTGGYLATGKKSRSHEDVGQLLVQVSGLLLIIVLCLPGIHLSHYEMIGLFVTIPSGSILGVGLWRDTPAMNREQQNLRSSRNDP